VNHQTEREGEQPRLLLWDLDTSVRRAGLLLPEVSNPFPVEYSADGRYVFARYWTWPIGSGGLRWWDAETGRQVGGVQNPGHTTFIDGGRVLVTHPSRVRGSAAWEGYLLGFWDVATGEPLGEWDLGAPADGCGMINGLVASDAGRYLAAPYDPDYGRDQSVRCRVLDWLPVTLFARSSAERQQILIWDIVERRELARLTGRSAALSGDGRWLATLDEAGVVRVWEIPMRRPWARILEYAAACSMGCWALATLLGRLRSRRSTSPCFDAVPGGPVRSGTTGIGGG
jgi:WD40 repeat protein